MKAIVYIRVSTSEQVENTSLSNQERACRAWCQREGYEVIGVFRDEGESAKTKDRPGLLRALEATRKGKADAFVVWKIDRLSRNQSDFHNLRAFLARFGTQLRSATETLTDDPAGKLMEGILAAFAQFDNDVRAERTRAGMLAAARAGYWVWKAPLGYMNQRTANGKASLAVDPERAPLVKQCFELFACGGLRQSDILKRLHSQGLRWPNGRPVSGQTLRKMLTNPVYAGWIANGFVGPEPVKGHLEPLISQEEFDKVQARLAGKEPTQRRTDRPDFPLRAFVRCVECGRPLTAAWSTGRSKKYPYYRCHGCGAVNVRKEVLEEGFLELLGSLRVRESRVRLFREIVLDAWRGRFKTAKAALRKQEKQAEQLEAEKERLVDLLLKKLIDEDTYRQRIDKTKTQLALAKMDERTCEAESLDIEAVLAFAGRMLLEPAKMWQCGSLEQRQRLQELLFPDGLAWNGENFGTVVTCSVVQHLQDNTPQETALVPPRGVEPRSPD